MSNKKFLFIPIVLAIIAVAITFILNNQKINPKKLDNFILLDTSKDIKNFELIDHNNNKFSLDSFADKWSLVFFGFTFCPDICPITMFDMSKVIANLEKKYPQTQLPQIIFVSVDPKRDSPDKIKKYVSAFSKSFIGLTGTKDNIDILVDEVYAMYTIPQNPTGNYLVNHSGTIHLIDPQKKLRGIFKPPIKADELTYSLISVLEHFDNLF